MEGARAVARRPVARVRAAAGRPVGFAVVRRPVVGVRVAVGRPVGSAIGRSLVARLRAAVGGLVGSAVTDRPVARVRAVLGRLAGVAGGGAAEPRVALVVDGPNVLRGEFDVDLDDVRAAGAALGRLAVVRLYLDEHATPELVQAAEARGFEVVVTSGDVDVRLAVDATALVADGDADVLAVVSRDTDFKPLVEQAARRGVRTVAVAPGEHGRSDALANAAHESVVLDG